MLKPMRYTAYIVQTDEIMECSNLQVLYKAARRHARYSKKYEGVQAVTVQFYVNLPAFSFEGFTPFHVASW